MASHHAAGRGRRLMEPRAAHRSRAERQYNDVGVLECDLTNRIAVTQLCRARRMRSAMSPWHADVHAAANRTTHAVD